MISQSHRPLFSVILTSYQSAAYIDTAIAGVLRQTLRNYELIMVDGGSSDSTLDRLKRMETAGAKAKALLGNPGPAVLMNTGLNQARGRYVAFLEADDSWRSDYLARAAAELARPGTAAALFGCDIANKDGRIVGRISARGRAAHGSGGWRIFAKDAILARIAGRLRPVCLSAVTFRRSVIERLGGFDPSFRRICADTDLMYRLALAYGRCSLRYYGERLVLQRSHPGQLTRRIALPRAKIKRQIKRLDAEQRLAILDQIAFNLKHAQITDRL